MKKRLLSLFLALSLLFAFSPSALAVAQVEGPDTAAIAQALAEGARRLTDFQELPGPFVETPEELAEFIYAQADARNEDGYFFYIISPEQLLSQSRRSLKSNLSLLLYCNAIGFDCQIEELSDQLVRVEVQQELRPGLRMLDAWRAGDWSTLSGQEQEALSIAQAEVERILAEYTDPLQIERAIHDYICLNFTYTDDDPEAEYSCLNAAHALLSGQANCQGYADAFYLMAGMAGFQVKNLCCWVLVEEGATHIFNLIELDGSWYIVDCTRDDVDDGPLILYIHFNAGRGLEPGILAWEDYWEPCPIEETDRHFFFNSDSFEHSRSSSMDELAAYALERFYEQGEACSYMVLEGWDDGSGFSAAFNSAMVRQSRPGTYWNYYFNILGGDTYISVSIYM